MPYVSFGLVRNAFAIGALRVPHSQVAATCPGKPSSMGTYASAHNSHTKRVFHPDLCQILLWFAVAVDFCPALPPPTPAAVCLRREPNV